MLIAIAPSRAQALSWLDESSADRMSSKMEREEDIAAFARLEVYGEEVCLNVLNSLINGFEVEISTGPELDEKEKAKLAIFGGLPDNKAKLALLHLENRFAKFDPTHTRDMLAYLKMTYKGQTLSCELQLIHGEILQVTERMDTYTHLHYFRQQSALLLPAGETLDAPAVLDEKFENALLFAEEAAGVPVLLSMFVLILVSGAEDLSLLPTSRLELYQTATDSALRRRIKRTLVAPKEEPKPEAGKDGEGKGKGEEKKADEKKAKAAKDATDAKDAAAKSEAAAAKEKEASAKELDLMSKAKEDAKKKEKEKKEKEKEKAAAKKESKAAAGQPQLNLTGAIAQKLEPLKGEESVTGCHSVVMKILEKVRNGDNLRDSIQRYVPEGNKLRPWAKALVEASLEPPAVAAQATGLRMLRRIAIANQEAGRREFSSKDVALTLGPHGDELILWLRLEQNQDFGVALIKMLEPPTDQLPAQYQFKHLSFQEGMFAEHLLSVVEDPSWTGWDNDAVAAAFLNNAYMNNTCRIAAGRLGTLLARRRPSWNFSDPSSTLGIVGRRALWFLLEGNHSLAKLNMSGNEVGSSDGEGIVNLFKACAALKSLDLSNNNLDTLKRSQLSAVCRALNANVKLTEVNFSNNRMGADGCKAVCAALQGCVGLKYLGLSHNQPGREMALPDLLRTHKSLTDLSIIESDSKGLDSRAKDNIGQALLQNDAGKLCFCECDSFALTPETKALVWTSALPADAVLLAGVLKTNTTLTSFASAAGNKLADSGRAAIGRALLQNKAGRVGFCDELGLREGVKSTEIDLATSFHSVEGFMLLAGVLRANRTLTSLTMNSLKTEHIEPLAEGLRSNSTLEILRLQSSSNKGAVAGGVPTKSVVTLPIQLLNGALRQPVIDLSSAGTLSRVSCAVVGVLLAENKTVKTLKLSKASHDLP